jgi:protein-serine/threonine kinase
MNTPPRSSSSSGSLELVNWKLSSTEMSLLAHHPVVFEPLPMPPFYADHDSSLPSSPDSRSIDHHDPIPEEDEDETGSEAVEPVTPTSARQSHEFRRMDISGDAAGDSTPIPAHISHPPPEDKTKPLVLRTSGNTTPPRSLTAPSPSTSTQSQKNGTNAVAVSPDTSAPPLLKRTATNATKRLSSLFRRSNSHNSTSSGAAPTDQFAVLSLHNAQGQGRRPSSFSMSANATPATSQSNSPPSPGSPADTLHNPQHWQPDFSTPQIARASSGITMINPARIMFSTSAKPSRPSNRKRSTSMTDLKYVKDDNAITRPAATGAGLKARRMSTRLPEDFDVEAVELKDEFSSTSVVPGRRGKTVGTGATATVKLMVRKSGPPDVIYAVKEFRKRSKHENESEYVKKVKSEYAIAKSLHHPNIVETVRLCTHSGRWNHVMEYCAQGDLHTLVTKGYLKDADHLCLFKQLLRGVAYLHNHGIAHRDIKLQNLLMTSQGQLKITDFGVSEVFSGEHPGLRGVGLECGKNMKETRRCAPGICGSRPYIAPEVLSKKGQAPTLQKIQKLRD